MRRLSPVAFLLAAGCVGQLDAPPVEGGPLCLGLPTGDAPLRRITDAQWRATVDDLLGPGASDGVDYPEALYRRGYRTDAVLGEVSRDGAVALAEAAATVAERSVPASPDALLGCAPTTAPDDACVSGWIDDFGARAFRRPLSTEEQTSLRALYADLVGVEALSTRDAVIGVVEAVLASPELNYLSTDATSSDGAAYVLDDFAVAERMSFFLWNEPPDAALRTAATEGRLHTPEDIEVEARRMVEDPRAVAMLSGFVEDWLELHRVRAMTKDPATFPAWASGLRDSVVSEHEAFVAEVMAGDGRLATLLTADFAVADANLAAVYGTGEGRVALGDERRGILNLTGFLAGHAGSTESAPVLRGVTVIRQLLCQEMELPVGVNVTSPAADPTRTTRERFTAHRAEPACGRCHDRIDPLGFAFEDFDAIGQHRDVDENGHTIDATASIRSGAFDAEVDGGASLSEALAASPVVRDCFARQVFTYAEGRVLGETVVEEAADACAVEQVAERFATADGDLRELLVAIVTSDAFLRRRAN